MDGIPEMAPEDRARRLAAAQAELEAALLEAVELLVRFPDGFAPGTPAAALAEAAACSARLRRAQLVAAELSTVRPRRG